MPVNQSPLPGYAAQVFETHDLWVVSGANHGDAIAGPEASALGDVYQLHPAARAHRIVLAPGGEAEAGRPRIGSGSAIGQPGDRLKIVALYTFLAPDGERIEVILLEHPGLGPFVLPLSPLAPRTDYTLIDMREAPHDIRLTDVICVSFAAGTLITVAGGAQRPIETLRPGDLVLTRDHGPQPIRWIGHATMRAAGSFAPVVIGAGTLGNGADLVVSPHHRVFIYQRGQRRLAGVAEILVQAKHLVDGEFVRRREGGFVDYFSLVFDRHEIIYAEGIPAESLMVSEATVGVLPEALAADLRRRFPGLAQSQHYGTEVSRKAIEDFGRETLFRFPKKP